MALQYGQSTWAQIASPVQLNAPLAMYGDVSEFEFSPDGDTVVYSASQDTIGVIELYTVPAGGGISTKLNPPLVSGGDVKRGHKVSPDGAFVVYIADQDKNVVNELYSVPIGGGAAIKLNPSLGDLKEVFDFKISADSTRVIYRADQDVIDDVELYSVPIAGGAATKLNSALVTGGDVGNFEISGDSSQVVYSADQDIDDSVELYSSAITGGGATKLNSAFVDRTQDVSKFAISPDSAFVVYLTDAIIDGRFEVFSIPIAGGAETVLNGVLPLGGNAEDFAISADSSRVVFRAKQESVNIPSLYSNLISGGTPKELSPVFFGVNTRVSEFIISPNSDVVIFWWRNQVYKVPIDGSSGPVNMSPGFFVQNFSRPQFNISSDGNTVVFIGKPPTIPAQVLNIYSVPVSGSSGPFRLNEPLSSREDVINFNISNDSSRVAFVSNQLNTSVLDLFTVAITGGALERLNRDFPSGGRGLNTLDFSFSPNNMHIVYMVDQDILGEEELFSVAYPPPPIVDPNLLPCIPVKAENGAVIQICL